MSNYLVEIIEVDEVQESFGHDYIPSSAATALAAQSEVLRRYPKAEIVAVFAPVTAGTTPAHPC